MPRNISFMLTEAQVRNRTKTVTRRMGWKHLKPGQVLNAVRKGMGLKKGEKVDVICKIRVISVREEPLYFITHEDVVKEGFPGWSRFRFIYFFCASHHCHSYQIVTRIEFEYLEAVDEQ